MKRKTNTCELREVSLTIRMTDNRGNGGFLENGRDGEKSPSRNETRLEYSFLCNINRPFVINAVAAIKSRETIASRRDRARSRADYRDAAPFSVTPRLTELF